MKAEARRRREPRTLDRLRQSAKTRWRSQPYRAGEDSGGEIDDPLERRRSAGQDHTSPELAKKPLVLKFPVHEPEELVQPLFNDVSHQLDGDLPRLAGARAGDLHRLLRVGELDRGDRVERLGPLRLGKGDGETLDQVTRHRAAPDGEDPDVANLAIAVDHELRRRSPDAHHRHPHLLLVLGENGARRRQRSRNERPDPVAGLRHGLPDVLGHRRGATRQEDVGLEPHARHSDRIGDPALAVDEVLLGDLVEECPVGRQRDGPRHPVNFGHVLARDLLVPERHNPERGLRAQVVTADSDPERPERDPGHELGLPHRAPDRSGRLVDVCHDLAPDPARPGLADPHDLKLGPATGLAVGNGDDRAGLRRSDIEAGNGISFHAPPPWFARVSTKCTTTWPWNRRSTRPGIRSGVLRSASRRTRLASLRSPGASGAR